LVIGGGGFHIPLETQEIIPSFRTLTYEAKRFLDLPRQQSTRQNPLVVNEVFVMIIAFIITFGEIML